MTHDEIMAEAIRRGFGPGCKYQCTSGTTYYPRKDQILYWHSLDKKLLALRDGGGLIYDGRSDKWGTVLSPSPVVSNPNSIVENYQVY